MKIKDILTEETITDGYIIVSSGKDITRTIENNIGTITKDKIYKSYADAVKRRKELLSYRSAHAKSLGMTEIILKVKNNKIIGK